MKLFLSSKSIMNELTEPFVRLVGKDLSSIRFGLIENAADPYSEKETGFLYKTRAELESLNMQLERLDLRNYVNKSSELEKVLGSLDVVWIGGGEPFYLRWLLQETGFDTIIQPLLEKGLVYGGGSAGAIVAGPTLENFNTSQEPARAPEIIEAGLNLTDLVIIPHWGTPEYQEELESIKDGFRGTIYKVMALTDDQAIMVIDGRSELLPKE